MRGFAMKIYKYDANFLKKNKNKKILKFCHVLY